MSPDCPLARSEGLITEELDGELLVYDSETNDAHSLNAAVARVWRACDGERDIDALAVECGLDQDAVERALEALWDVRLLHEPEPESSPSISRRTMFHAAATAGAMIAAPIAINTIRVPAAAAQGSCTPANSCVNGGAPCCPGTISTADSPRCPTGVNFCCIPTGACGTPETCCTGRTPDSSCSTGFRCL